LDWFEGVDCSKIILAGGLNISNLDEVKKYNFYGFDVSSGVEKDKGVKDHLKIEAFISKAKS
jgi:phosphoribosylanthranilate isomerase